MTNETVTEGYGITRGYQTMFVAESHRKVSRAQNDGLFDKAIIPVEWKKVKLEDERNSKDDGIRHNEPLFQAVRLQATARRSVMVRLPS